MTFSLQPKKGEGLKTLKNSNLFIPLILLCDKNDAGLLGKA